MVRDNGEFHAVEVVERLSTTGGNEAFQSQRRQNLAQKKNIFVYLCKVSISSIGNLNVGEDEFLA